MSERTGCGASQLCALLVLENTKEDNGWDKSRAGAPRLEGRANKEEGGRASWRPHTGGSDALLVYLA